MELTGLELGLVLWGVLCLQINQIYGVPVDTVVTDDDTAIDNSPIEFPATCQLTKGKYLRRYDGTTRELPTVTEETVMSLCTDPSDFHVTVTISGSFSEGSAKMYVTVKDGSRVVKASIQQRGNFKYESYNTGSYDCMSMAGVQTIVRNFGESLVIETGFASIMMNRDLKLESYMVQNPRSPLCGTCGHVDDLSRTCALAANLAPGTPGPHTVEPVADEANHRSETSDGDAEHNSSHQTEEGFEARVDLDTPHSSSPPLDSVIRSSTQSMEKKP